MTELVGEPTERVSRRAVAYWRLSALIGWAWCFGALGAAWWFLGQDLGWALPALAGLGAYALAHVVAMPAIRYRVHRWEVTPVAVRTRAGWLAREQRIAPLSRVQTVDSSQTALMRLFRLASLTVTTASAAGPVTIEGLDRATAERIAAELTAVTGDAPGDAT
ncbi:PH domain-containing protein [Cellulomonas bogoriensis]|uniref:Membrane protein n=1 Tax=Cellulomonas bogoriensis 69B4 = DSM 16987 TaxID=1386082 RepID=A0A0A0C0B7_9CELL|nr:PH domain-containing protein [Cellulomonas bogoriensis]KGM13382.1 membrane protein [Cellulomonas bogoriensis 69B4 = DSM 16987]